MSAAPDRPLRTVVIGIRLDASSPEQLRCAASLAQEVGSGGPLEFLVEATVGEEARGALEDLAARGHSIDLSTPGPLALGEWEPARLEDLLRGALERVRSWLPGQARGLRAGRMERVGIQKREDLQKLLLGLGVEFVSTDYSTRPPGDPTDPGFADKNAAMLIKHSQPRRYPTGLVEVPAAGYSDADLLEGQGRTVDQWLAHLAQCIDFAHDMGGLVYAPDIHMGVLMRRDAAALTVRRIIEHAGSRHPRPLGLCALREAAGYAE